MTNQTKWLIDKVHSEIGFKVRHLMIANTKGVFKVFDASIFTTGKDFRTTGINLWIETNSIDTGDTKRDEHLKAPDFFDVLNHKQITFTSSSIGESDAYGHHLLYGELTINNITKPIQLDVEFGGIVNDPWGNEKAGFSVKGKLKRSEWGLVWNTLLEAGGVIVSDEVSISCEIELINTTVYDSSNTLKPLEHKASNI